MSLESYSAITSITSNLLPFRLQHKDVFELIRKHDLYGVIKNMILKLIQLDSDKAITLFLEKEKIPPEVVVEQLEQSPEYLYMVCPVNNKNSF